MKKSLQFLLAMTLFMSSLAMAQITTSSINGRILEAENEPLLGATVLAVHNPTNTRYGASTDIEGYYRINNMRVGGPYTVTITYISKNEVVLNDIYLQLGESERIDATLLDSTNALDAIVIEAVRDGIFDSGKTGPETNISTREIETLPTVTRDIQDLLRKTPQAQVGEGGGISLGGQNNRYNSFYIDGAVSNDVFGLSGTGTNGGQIGLNPISLDAIESFSVNLAPFDVRQSGFAGGAINAITRSGTNKWSGSAYTYYRNQDLAGKTPGGFEADTREQLDEFTATRIGARIGGPIIKDKLFFFLNYERQDEETPRFFDAAAYNGDSSVSDIQTLRNNLIDTFGYNPGDFEDGTQSLTSNTFTARIDYNLNDKNTFTFKHNYVSGESNSPSLSNANSINFANAGVLFTSETNSSTFEWRTTNGSNLSNNLVIGYSTVNDDRDPIGRNFPRVQIEDGQNGSITFGSEAFSTGNILDQTLFNVTNNFEIQSGAHNFTIGGSFEHFDVRNVFVRQNFGQYQFLSLDDFNTYFDARPDVAADAYDYSYSLLDPVGVSGDDIVEAAAAFKYSMLGFYVQDAWNVADNFRLTYGVRFDMPFFENGKVNEDFNTRTVGILEAAGQDLQGARVGKPIKSQIHVAPRLGFNWDVKNDNATQIRGGIGVFTSRIPLVWPGGAYNNNGISVGSVDERDFDNGQVFFNPDAGNQPIGNGAAPGSGELGGQIDLFSPDFRLPQRLKYNLGIDQKTNIWGLIASADFLYNDVISDVTYQNLNTTGPVGTLNGADNRFYYNRNRLDTTYNNIYLGTNTSEGYSYNATFTLTKPVKNGFGGQVAYTYGDGEMIFEGTSSQNSSQWRNVLTVNGKNTAQLQNSQFATGHQIIANATYRLDWNDKLATTFGMFYTGQNGGRISYIYNEGRDLLGDDSRDNALLYVPRDASEINLVDFTRSNGQVVTAAEQFTALDRFIENDDYLSGRRGQYAEANASRASWNHSIDLKILQDFSIYTGADKENKNTLQVSLDVFNFANLLNNNWGQRTFVPNFGEVGLITTQSGGPNPSFTFDPEFTNDDIEVIDDGGTRSSRWQMQVGLRYIFN